jgi:hypothetical protein
MKELSIELRNMAREAGLCDQWFGEWNDDSDNTTLFDKYKRGIDFCIEHGYPTNEFIKSHWDKEMLRITTSLWMTRTLNLKVLKEL